MPTFKGKQGEWKTLDNGVHIFIVDGQSLDDAIKNLKPREYYSYWKKNTNDKYGFESWSGISRREYDRLLKEGKDVEARPFGKGNDWYKSIPDDIEYRVWNALENINDIKNQKDFREQLRKALFGNGVHTDNYNVIVDAFRDEIVEKYNKLIEPRMKELNSIDIDNSDNYFMKNINKQSVSQKFKDTLMKRFDECKDESLKSIAAANTELGLKFLENEETDEFGNRIGTCYMPLRNSINIKNDDQDTETVFHEMFHGVFEKYDVVNSGLKEILKEEFHKNIKAIKQYFGPEEYAKRNNIDYTSIKNEYDSTNTDLEEKRKIMNDIYNNKLEAIAKGGPKTAMVYDELHKQLKADEEYILSEKNFWDANRKKVNAESKMKRLINNAEDDLTFLYPNFADMCSGYTLNKFGFGHSQNYWRENKTNHVNEFFAEMSAIKATGSNELEFIKKWLPKSVAKYEEIIKNISNNKGKALELDL